MISFIAKIFYLTIILILFYLKNYDCVLSTESIINKFNKLTSDKQAIKLIKLLIYKNNFFKENTFLLKYFVEKNWTKSFNLCLMFLIDYNSNENNNYKEVKNIFNTLNYKDKEIIKNYNNIVSKYKKKDIIRISPVFEWSQDDETIKIRIKFSKNLESPGEKYVQNFKVNCTRSQLEIQGYKEHKNLDFIANLKSSFDNTQDNINSIEESIIYLIHYYRRLNLFEFIRPSTCKSYKETDGTYIVHFKKNQYTLYWNFLNQPTEDHYNLHTWFEVFSVYDGKIQYTEFRETAMENLLLSDLDEYTKQDMPSKVKRIKRIENAAKFIKIKDSANKNFCLCSTEIKLCKVSKLTEWGYWQF